MYIISRFVPAFLRHGPKALSKTCGCRALIILTTTLLEDVTSTTFGSTRDDREESSPIQLTHIQHELLRPHRWHHSKERIPLHDHARPICRNRALQPIKQRLMLSLPPLENLEEGPVRETYDLFPSHCTHKFIFAVVAAIAFSLWSAADQHRKRELCEIFDRAWLQK